MKVFRSIDDRYLTISATVRKWFFFRRRAEFSVRLLPVRMLGRFYAILEHAATDATPEVTANARRKLRELALTTCPRALEGEFMRMDYANMAEIVTTLFFGEDGEKKASAKAGESGTAKELDWDFLAAKICHVFGAYDMDKALSEPPGVFLSLHELAGRVQKDDAIENLVPGIGCALNGSAGLEELYKSRGEIIRSTKIPGWKKPCIEYTEEQLEAAYKRMHDPNLKTIRTFSPTDIVGKVL